jgi:hypothetical protein
MAFDALWFTVGLVAGIVGTAVLLEAMGRARQTTPQVQSKLTTGWRISELADPVLVARDVLDVDVPAQCPIYASGVVSPELVKRGTVRQVPPVRTEFALDRKRARALIFTAGVRDDALALVTVDEELVSRLESEWRLLATRAGDYVERLRIQDLAGRTGVSVETRGLVKDVLPFRDRFMMRLEDEGHVIGVLVEKDPGALRDERVLVRGGLRKDETGYPVIEAVDIRRIR